MGEVTYFCDSYALFEMIKGNRSYVPFRDAHMMTTLLNLMELYYGILEEKGKAVAEHYFEFFSGFLVPLEADIIKDAMGFRLLNKKRKLSYVDCVGYVTARRYRALFLTGDKEFQEMPDVEFRK